jgi:hypothetical protein
LHVLFGHSSLDPARDLFGDLAHAMQQHVAVAQQDAVMVMVGVAYFPEDLAVPVRFQRHAAFERKATEKVLLGGAPVVKQGPAFCFPRNAAECKPRERALSFASAQANTSAFEGILLDGGYDRAGDEDRARTDSGRAGEHRATL